MGYAWDWLLKMRGFEFLSNQAQAASSVAQAQYPQIVYVNNRWNQVRGSGQSWLAQKPVSKASQNMEDNNTI